MDSFPSKVPPRRVGCRFAGSLRFFVLLCFLTTTFAESKAEPLKWEQRKGFRVAPLNVPKTGKTGFTLLTPAETGIIFTNQLSYERGQKNQNLLNGAGVASGDFDGDGNTDLYFCNL